jgi:fructosamine-3-kinase
VSTGKPRAARPSSLDDAVEAVAGRRPLGTRPLAGGCIAQVLKVDLGHGEALVAKVAPGGGLAIEARMLRFLRRETALPVPAVVFAGDDLLLLEFVETSGGLDAGAEAHAAELLADLHSRTAPAFGFDCDTVIGPLPQPNPWTEDWLEFFRDQRLLFMGRRALDSGHLPAAVFDALGALCGRLDRYIDGDRAPALIHGDVWGGNVLVRGGRVAAFIDPAVYYADPEIELAFATLFGTFGKAFFGRYREIRPLSPGFFEVRRDLYNLYPLLVHTALFGAGYAQSVARIVKRYS